MGQPARQPVGMAVERGLRASLARGGSGGDAGGIVRARAVAVARQRRAGDPGLQAVPMAAPALPAGHLVGPRPGQRIVAPLAGDVVASAQHLAVHHHAAAAAGAEDDAENRAVTGARAIARFRQGEAVGVVLHPHLAAEQGADVAVERVAVQCDGVGVLHQAGGRADHAGNADAHRGGDAKLRFRIAHEAGDPLERGLVAVRRVDPVAMAFAAVGRQDRDLDLGAAEVDADTVRGHAGAQVLSASATPMYLNWCTTSLTGCAVSCCTWNTLTTREARSPLAS